MIGVPCFGGTEQWNLMPEKVNVEKLLWLTELCETETNKPLWRVKYAFIKGGGKNTEEFQMHDRYPLCAQFKLYFSKKMSIYPNFRICLCFFVMSLIDHFTQHSFSFSFLAFDNYL